MELGIGVGYWSWVLALGVGVGYWSWVLELGFGVGYWSWVLELGFGVGCWHWVLELGIGIGCWSWVLELGIGVEGKFLVISILLHTGNIRKTGPLVKYMCPHLGGYLLLVFLFKNIYQCFKIKLDADLMRFPNLVKSIFPWLYCLFQGLEAKGVCF